MTVPEGADAFFACTYHGTTGVPVWRITNNVFVTSALPPRHSYNGSGLVVSNVDLSLNMNSYSCFFNVHIGRGRFVDIESTTGFLVIAGLHASITQSVLQPINFNGYMQCSINKHDMVRIHTREYRTKKSLYQQLYNHLFSESTNFSCFIKQKSLL